MGKLRWLVEHSSKMFVLAAIYGAMNILSFVALQYIGAGEFTICAQLKILTTAAFSVVILRTQLTWTKWRALASLVLGCILVASPNFSSHAATGAGASEHPDQHEPSESSAGGGGYQQLLGYGAVLTEVILSGFASIYFEKVVKSTTEVVTIWERNFQLGIYSMVIYVSIMIYEGGAEGHVAWSNWSFLTFLVACAGAGGGLLVAATLKYADSILKTLAAAGAIVLSTILGHVFLDGPLDYAVVIGALATIIAIADYTYDSTPPALVLAATDGSNKDGASKA